MQVLETGKGQRSTTNVLTGVKTLGAISLDSTDTTNKTVLQS